MEARAGFLAFLMVLGVVFGDFWAGFRLGWCGRGDCSLSSLVEVQRPLLGRGLTRRGWVGGVAGMVVVVGVFVMGSVRRVGVRVV